MLCSSQRGGSGGGGGGMLGLQDDWPLLWFCLLGRGGEERGGYYLLSE